MRIELYGKSTGISFGIRGTFFSTNGGKSYKYRGFLRFTTRLAVTLGEKVCSGDV